MTNKDRVKRYYEILFMIWTGVSGNVSDDRRDALAAADTKRGRAILQIVTPQLVHQCDNEARATGGQRMPNRDGSSVDVGSIAIKAKFFFDGEVLGRERLVDL